jgi:hypothetical protein
MALKTTPTTGTLDGLSFGTGPDANGWSLVVNVWKNWDSSSPASAQHEDKPTDNGSYRSPNYRRSKTMQLICTGHSEDATKRAALIRKIQAILGDPDTVYPLTRVDTDGLALTTWVELDGEVGVERRPDGRHLYFDIPVKAADGQKYTADNAGQTTSPVSQSTDGIQWMGTGGITGIEWNGPPGSAATGLVWQVNPGNTGTVRLFNSGTRKAPVRLSVDPTAVNPQIDCVQTNQRVRWAGTVTSTLLINTGTGRVTMGGLNVSGDLSDSDFFFVPPGGFIDLVYSVTSGSGQLTAVNANVYA